MERREAYGVCADALEKFEGYLQRKECAALTRRKYCKDVGLFLQYLGEKQIITREILLSYKEWLSGQYAVSSVNSMLAALNQFLEFLELDGWKVRRLRVQRQLFLRQEKTMTEREYGLLLGEAQRQKKYQLALIIETLAGTGARVGELPFFTVKQARRGQIEIRHKGKCRQILLPRKLRDRLLTYAARKGIERGPIFVTRNGKPKDRSNIWNEMKALGRKAGVDAEKIFPHNLRHFFARSYYELTRDLAGLAGLLGHSSLEVTRIYTAHPVRFYQRAIDQLEKRTTKNTT